MPADQEEREERWLRALGELPRPELTSARHAEITASLHSALTPTSPTLSSLCSALIERWVEPSLVVSCSALVLVRLVIVLAQYFNAA